MWVEGMLCVCFALVLSTAQAGLLLKNRLLARPLQITQSALPHFPIAEPTSVSTGLTDALLSVSKQGVTSFIHTAAVMIPENILRSVWEHYGADWNSIMKHGFSIGLEYALKSAAFSAGSELSARIRRVRDGFNPMIGTGCSAAVSNRNNGWARMAKSFAYGACYHYGKTHFVPQWINAISNPYSDILGKLRSIGGANSFMRYWFDRIKLFILSVRLPVM